MKLFCTPVILLLGAFLPSVLSSDIEHWSTVAARSKDGIIKLDSTSYDELLASDRDYSVSVILTALDPRFKCGPCREFDPSWHQVANSWRRVPKHERDKHFFAELDFANGEAVYRRLGLTTAPTIQFHPALTGDNKSNKLSVVTFDLNRHGLGPQPFHAWLRDLTPAKFDLHVPFNPVPFIMVPATMAFVAFAAYQSRAALIPIVQSRIVWGVMSVLLILTFTSGHMWNRIKGAPYVAEQNGVVSWIAGGYQNQLGLESQVVAGVYGTLSFIIIALTILVPTQSSPAKQRVGVYLWLGMFVVVFSLLIKLFRVKNDMYPYRLLF